MTNITKVQLRYCSQIEEKNIMLIIRKVQLHIPNCILIIAAQHQVKLLSLNCGLFNFVLRHISKISLLKLRAF